MMDATDLIDFVSNAALLACGGNVRAHKAALWDVAVALLADCLRNSDQLSRERMLRGVEDELRDAVAHLERLLCPLPRTPPRMH
jgi:hypothetical protein